MAATPPAQLARALHAAVWKSAGARTRFDPDVFVDWLEVWLEEGDAFTADRLLALDEDFLALCFSAVLRVDDADVVGFERSAEADGPLLDPGDGHDGFALGRFLVAPAQDDEWDVVLRAVLALWEHDPRAAAALLERLARLDPDTGAAAHLHEDAAAAREVDQERSGYVPPAAARAFLATASGLSMAELCAMTTYDPETARHFRSLDATAPGQREMGDPAHRGDDQAAPERDGRWAPGPAEAEARRLLVVAGLLDDPPAARLAAPASRPALALEQRLEDLAAADPHRWRRAAAELAWLANVLMTGVMLPGADPRPEAAARDLAFAAANLGVELLERQGLPVIPGEAPGLIRAFLVAWRVMAELPVRVAGAFGEAFAGPGMKRYLEPRVWLRQELTEALRDLETAVAESRPDAAREAVTMLSLAFDTTACRAAAHLLSWPPRFPLLLEGTGRDDARWLRSVADLDGVARLLGSLGPKA